MRYSLQSGLLWLLSVRTNTLDSPSCRVSLSPEPEEFWGLSADLLHLNLHKGPPPARVLGRTGIVCVLITLTRTPLASSKARCLQPSLKDLQFCNCRDGLHCWTETSEHLSGFKTTESIFGPNLCGFLFLNCWEKAPWGKDLLHSFKSLISI